MSLNSITKGWFGEIQGTLAQKIFLDSNYVGVNNVTIPTINGTTQIDHIIVSRYGIFVIEAKNMKGWIFGDEKSPQWTQSLFSGTFRFQNPLHQNYRHTKALSEFLGIEHNKFFSMVMFWGECTFKTPMPSNVMNSGYISYIKSKTVIIFSDEKVQEIVNTINEGMLSKSWATRQQHIGSLKERFENVTTCPKCGATLILRTAKSGTNAGSQFYGCTAYPSCWYTAKFETKA
jgi:predicted RNA-binding Zn-ribbon protein involved in translation (DUF1610 family)